MRAAPSPGPHLVRHASGAVPSPEPAAQHPASTVTLNPNPAPAAGVASAAELGALISVPLSPVAAFAAVVAAQSCAIPAWELSPEPKPCVATKATPASVQCSDLERQLRRTQAQPADVGSPDADAGPGGALQPEATAEGAGESAVQAHVLAAVPIWAQPAAAPQEQTPAQPMPAASAAADEKSASTEASLDPEAEQGLSEETNQAVYEAYGEQAAEELDDEDLQGLEHVLAECSESEGPAESGCNGYRVYLNPDPELAALGAAEAEAQLLGCCVETSPGLPDAHALSAEHDSGSSSEEEEARWQPGPSVAAARAVDTPPYIVGWVPAPEGLTSSP